MENKVIVSSDSVDSVQNIKQKTDGIHHIINECSDVRNVNKSYNYTSFYIKEDVESKENVIELIKNKVDNYEIIFDYEIIDDLDLDNEDNVVVKISSEKEKSDINNIINEGYEIAVSFNEYYSKNPSCSDFIKVLEEFTESVRYIYVSGLKPTGEKCPIHLSDNCNKFLEIFESNINNIESVLVIDNTSVSVNKIENEFAFLKTIIIENSETSWSSK